MMKMMLMASGKIDCDKHQPYQTDHVLQTSSTYAVQAQAHNFTIHFPSQRFSWTILIHSKSSLHLKIDNILLFIGLHFFFLAFIGFDYHWIHLFICRCD